MILYGVQGPVNNYLSAWAGERIGIADWGPCKSIGVLRDHEVVAVAVFNNWIHPNIEISFVTSSHRWATREAIRAILAYPFVQLQCKRITSTTKATNQRARAFLCRLGFREEGYHPDVFEDDDAVSYGLLARDAARWIGAEVESRGKSIRTISA